MRRWYQNVEIEGLAFEDPNRKGSKFWNEGKWHNFIEPLLPKDRRTFVEIGCNAGLYLKMAVEAGFKNVIGVEANPQIMAQATCFRDYSNGTWKLLQQRVGEDFVLDYLPLADVTLLANVHYYFPVGVFSNLVDRLKSRTLYCVLVSGKAPRRLGNAVHWIDAVRGYFRDWIEVGSIEGLEKKGDPAQRKQMYGISFRGNLDVCDVKKACDRWYEKNSSRHKDLTIFPALEEFFRKVLADEIFNSKETLLYQYWTERSPHASPGWILEKLAYKKHLAEDIQANGMKEPLYYDQKGKLLDGIHRLVIAKELGYEHVLIRRL